MNLPASSYGVARQGYVVKRKQLDRYLAAVEEEIERGEELVSPQLAGTLRPLVPAVERGMFLADALELVFASQEELFSCQAPDEPLNHHLAAGHTDGPHVSWSLSSHQARLTSGRQISVADAKELTSRIRDGLGDMPLLLLEAHEERAWIPLGHRSWEQYVRLEFGLSRSRSYELLDQARVIRALRLAAATERIPPISALAAIQIKPRLGEVVDEVRRRLCGERNPNVSEQIDNIVRDAVAGARTRASVSKAPASPTEFSRTKLRLMSERETTTATSTGVALTHLIDAIAVLAHLPPAVDVAGGLSDDESEQLFHLPAAARWLSELLIEWTARHSLPHPELNRTTKARSESRPIPAQGRIARRSPESESASI